jgi:hypothetical protein
MRVFIVFVKTVRFYAVIIEKSSTCVMYCVYLTTWCCGYLGFSYFNTQSSVVV